MAICKDQLYVLYDKMDPRWTVCRLNFHKRKYANCLGNQSRLKYVCMYMNDIDPKPKLLIQSRFAGYPSEVNAITFTAAQVHHG